MATSYTIAPIVAIALLFGVLFEAPSGVQSVGVCYGMIGSNLPRPSDTVNLYKSNRIGGMRLYYPDPAALQALRGSGVGLILDVGNDNLQRLASDPGYANSWVQTNVAAYAPDVAFRCIAVGNEVIGNEAIARASARDVLPAMQNIQNALTAANLGYINVSTAVSQGIVTGFPPSQGVFKPEVAEAMQQIVQFLASTTAPFLLNVYPYFSVRDNREINLDYALFTAPGPVVTDGLNQYHNLFHALMDTAYSAVEKAGGANVQIVASETGWPSAGGNASITTVENAQKYNQNLIRHLRQGTPKRPVEIRAYLFAMFNEDKKDGDETERHFGLFYPNQQPVYQISFDY